jgi:hypothetical protein
MGMPKYDLGSIWKMMFRDETRSLAVSLAENTQFDIELNAEDGDSVEAVPKFVCIDDLDVKHDAKRFKNAVLYIKPLRNVFQTELKWIDIYVNPKENGDTWFKLARVNVSGQEPFASDLHTICAAEIKVESNLSKEDVELKLVMRS